MLFRIICSNEIFSQPYHLCSMVIYFISLECSQGYGCSWTVITPLYANGVGHGCHQLLTRQNEESHIFEIISIIFSFVSTFDLSMPNGHTVKQQKHMEIWETKKYSGNLGNCMCYLSSIMVKVLLLCHLHV